MLILDQQKCDLVTHKLGSDTVEVDTEERDQKYQSTMLEKI